MATRDQQRTRSIRPCKHTPDGKHCEHFLAADFGISAPDLAEPIRARASICCHCGTARAIYIGPNENERHGPYVEYVEPPKVMTPVPPGLIIPGGHSRS